MTREVNDNCLGLEGICGPFRRGNAAAQRALSTVHYSVVVGQRFPRSLHVVVCRGARRQIAGAFGAEVWVEVVDADAPAPTGPAALTFGTITTTPASRAEFKAARTH